MMKRIALVTAAIILGSISAYADDTIAYNHGYAAAALSYCGDAVKVTDQKAQETADKKYRKTKAYREGFDFVSAAPRSSYKAVAICTRAGIALVGINWLELDKDALTKLQRDRQ